MTPAPKGNELLAAALDLASRGLPVFPCAPGAKSPATKHGLHEATTDPDKVTHFWATRPQANVAVRTGSGLIVLDVDGEVGADSLADLERRHGSLPLTVSVKTGNGHHFYFHCEEEVRNSVRKLSHGLDVRGDGGYVIAPPSRHPSGERYTWDGAPDELPVAVAPAWLLDRLRTSQSGTNRAPLGDAIPEGRRNSTLASLAGTMRHGGMRAEEIDAALQVTNNHRCQPPLPVLEVEQIALSIARYEPADRASTQIATGDGKKLILPDTPSVDDASSQCEWLTEVFRLDPTKPIIGGVIRGVRGPDACVSLHRADAQDLNFEPVKHVNSPPRLIEHLAWQTGKTDAAIPGFTAAHCRHISHVIRMLCDGNELLSEGEETSGLVSAYLAGAERIEGYTSYGTSGQRYEAAVSLRRETDGFAGRPTGPPRYLIDANTGEFLIAVGDLIEHSRRFIGSSIPRGWLDARMQGLGWRRVRLDGHQLPGRVGRLGPHLRIDAYRGHLPADTDQSVTT